MGYFIVDDVTMFISSPVTRSSYTASVRCVPSTVPPPFSSSGLAEVVPCLKSAQSSSLAPWKQRVPLWPPAPPVPQAPVLQGQPSFQESCPGLPLPLPNASLCLRFLLHPKLRDKEPEAKNG